MNGGITREGMPRAQAWRLALVLCALLIRALLPSGLMVAATPAGALTVTLCSGRGPVEVLVDAHGQLVDPDTVASSGTGEPGDDSRAKHDAPCAFAGLLAPALLVEASLPVVPPMAVAPGVATSGVGIGTGLAAPPPPATGPPPSLI
ncbi:DUF2946 family protein [Sphingosinicellaceae bacterium M-36]